MFCFLNSLSPQNYTLSAVVAGFLLTSDLDFVSQDILGGWLMLVGQLIQTNAAFGQSQCDMFEECKEKADSTSQQTETQSQPRH